MLQCTYLLLQDGNIEPEVQSLPTADSEIFPSHVTEEQPQYNNTNNMSNNIESALEATEG